MLVDYYYSCVAVPYAIAIASHAHFVVAVAALGAAISRSPGAAERAKR